VEPDVDVNGALGRTEGWYARHQLPARFVYWGIHASCLFVFTVGVTTGDLMLLAATFLIRMFGITGGYHRYFAHKTYKTGRVFQGVMAVIACTATQKGPLWWAGHHRGHHKYADQVGKDVHSPSEGAYYAHQGWIFDDRWDETPIDRISEFKRYPELVWLNRWHAAPPLVMGIACYAIAGLSGLVWGVAISTTLLWHSTYVINSLAHRWGTRRYDTKDTSRNNGFLALLTLGEGWHNNHHHYPSSVNQGFFWWEIDVTYYILRGLEKLGLVWDLREPPRELLEGG